MLEIKLNDEHLVENFQAVQELRNLGLTEEDIQMLYNQQVKKDEEQKRTYGETLCDKCELQDKECHCDCAREFVEKKKYDNVNRPSHYCTGKFECIDVMLETQGKQAVLDFCLCNAFKYLYRHNGKNGYEDVKKAKWYIDKFIKLAEEPGVNE